MAMYLGECPVYSTMMIGRWSSDAFLRHIAEDEGGKVLRLDSRQHNHPYNVQTRDSVGGNVSHRVQLPAFSFFN
eukprot:7464628-Ditylum_brightwellii.AAC.1